MTRELKDLKSLSRPLDSHVPSQVPTPPSRWKTRLLLPGVIAVVALVLLGYTLMGTLLPATPVRVVPVVVKTVLGTAGTVTVQAPGWLEPDPHPYYVAALADGIVEHILVLEGEQVEAGQVVAQLVDDDAKIALRRAEAELSQQMAMKRIAEADLEAAELQLEHLIDVTHSLETAKIGVAHREAEILKAHADLEIERARLGELKDEFERKSSLIESKAVAEGIVVRLALRVDAQAAAVDAVLARKKVLEASLAQAQTDLNAQQARYQLLIEERRAVAIAGADVEQADASIALAQAARDDAALRFDRMSVRSPVSGIVLNRLVTPGSKLTREGGEHSAHVIHVYDPGSLQMRADIPLADAAQVAIGQEVEMTVEVLPDRTFKGRVTRIVHEADIQKNTVEVKVAIENPTSELKPEMLARAKFMAATQQSSNSEHRQRVFAPRRLLQRSESGTTTAYVVGNRIDDRGNVERRTVSIGPRSADGWTEVIDGLRPGDLLIAEPDQLKHGTRVRITGEDT